MGPLEHTSIQQLRDVFEVNVVGVLAVTQAFPPLLKRSEHSPDATAGRIVNISSTSGGVTFPMVGAYPRLNMRWSRSPTGFGVSLPAMEYVTIAIEPGRFARRSGTRTPRQPRMSPNLLPVQPTKN